MNQELVIKQKAQGFEIGGLKKKEEEQKQMIRRQEKEEESNKLK